MSNRRSVEARELAYERKNADRDRKETRRHARSVKVWENRQASHSFRVAFS